MTEEQFPNTPPVTPPPAPTPTPTPMTPQASSTPQDIEENKVFAILAYLSLLCLVPLFMKKDSPFAYYHAKQGLGLFAVNIAFYVLIEILITISPYAMWRIWSLFSMLGWLAILGFTIIGIWHVIEKKMEPLPFLGQISDKIVKKLNL